MKTNNLTASTNTFSDNDPPLMTRFGYSIEQVDPLEAKCAVIRSLLQDSEPLVTKDMISANITRDKLLLCVQLYGKLFQRNYPILHSPTFSLADTSPVLLLAMMLTGACYSEVISNDHVIKFCMSLLILIEKMPVCDLHPSARGCPLLILSSMRSICKSQTYLPSKQASSYVVSWSVHGMKWLPGLCRFILRATFR